MMNRVAGNKHMYAWSGIQGWQPTGNLQVIYHKKLILQKIVDIFKILRIISMKESFKQNVVFIWTH